MTQSLFLWLCLLFFFFACRLLRSWGSRRRRNKIKRPVCSQRMFHISIKRHSPGVIVKSTFVSIRGRKCNKRRRCGRGGGADGYSQAQEDRDAQGFRLSTLLQSLSRIQIHFFVVVVLFLVFFFMHACARVFSCTRVTWNRSSVSSRTGCRCSHCWKAERSARMLTKTRTSAWWESTRWSSLAPRSLDCAFLLCESWSLPSEHPHKKDPHSHSQRHTQQEIQKVPFEFQNIQLIQGFSTCQKFNIFTTKIPTKIPNCSQAK